ncbi:MAG: hypothetical protein IT204_02815 [Fimbriimonadaceae bacterium]|nr:hypothetical protein [Fimbriimonadaceae bacterium]
MRWELDLAGEWDLREALLSAGEETARAFSDAPDGWIPTPVPGDIHQGLQAAGRIADPLLGLHSHDCTWTEQRSWWFRRQFDLPAAALDAERLELTLDGLDANAQIWLNGSLVGTHPSAFRPFVADVLPLAQAGTNTLLVRLTSGVETVTEADLDAPDGVRAGTEAGNGRPERGDPRRTFVRKPQYSFGWDWSPRVATTAIAGRTTLAALRGAVLRDVRMLPQVEGAQVAVDVTVTVDQLHYYQTAPGELTVTLTDASGEAVSATCAALLRSGLNHLTLRLPLDQPRWWWPHGYGEQHLYQVAVTLQTAAGEESWPTFGWGLRTLELLTDHRFAVRVNGQTIWCKGANWIPADTLYARVDAAQYETLVAEAAACDFTMLRIWGGGLYERDAFYAACDRHGILIWHDFMFACAPYPDHIEWFRSEVEREADYQTRRLRNHACLALWSGNNENNWGFRDWWVERTRGGAQLYNYLLPTAVQRNCPELPYWNGSPYGGAEPNGCEVGDRHHWGDCMMHREMDKRITPEEYDLCQSLFVSEYGYVGPPCRATIEAYLAGAAPDRQSAVWQHHNNTFEKQTVEAGIRKHYADPEGLSLDEYLLYAGLCQGLMYGYAIESMRYRGNCHGSLFWMYADCWGEVGWTIVDAWLRRKTAWYHVQRAHAPLRLILRREGDTAHLVIANDTLQPAVLDLAYGYLPLDGSPAELSAQRIHAAATARTAALAFPLGDADSTRGLWVARAPGLEPAVLRLGSYRDLQVVDPGLTVELLARTAQTVHLAVSARAYAHAIHFDAGPDDRADACWFDLLPGTRREVRIDLATGSTVRAVRAVNSGWVPL